MLSDVVVVCNGEVIETLASRQDLDYWNIRQWRRVFIAYSLANEKNKYDCQLRVIPSEAKPF